MNRFNVGDKLRIRSWEDMVAEFGQDTSTRYITCGENIAFISTMRHMCGKPFTVRAISGELPKLYRSEEGVEEGYMITASMLEYDEIDTPIDQITEDEMMNFIGI